MEPGVCSDRGQPDYLTMFNRYLIKHKTPGKVFEEDVNTPEILINGAIQRRAIVPPRQQRPGKHRGSLGHFSFPAIFPFSCSVGDTTCFSLSVMKLCWNIHGVCLGSQTRRADAEDLDTVKWQRRKWQLLGSGCRQT